MKWQMAEMIGYTPITTFWDDFSIADRFGNSAIKDTFNRAFSAWKTNYKYLTELTIVLNHKIWQWHSLGDTGRAKLYETLWGRADNFALENLKDDELSYFLSVTD